MANGIMTRTTGRVLHIETVIRNKNTDNNATGVTPMQDKITGGTLQTTKEGLLSLPTVPACRIAKALQDRRGRRTAGKNLPVLSMA